MKIGRAGDTRVAYAGFWRRFTAYLIDMVVVMIGLFLDMSFVGNIFNTISATAQPHQKMTPFAAFLFMFGLFAMTWLYFALLESGKNQATLGMRVMRIWVVDENGERIRFGRATGRYFAKGLSALPMYIGFLLVAWTPRKQGIHDLLAGTLVISWREEPPVVEVAQEEVLEVAPEEVAAATPLEIGEVVPQEVGEPVPEFERASTN